MAAQWPLLLSVPHAGLEVPPEVADLHQLAPDEIRDDGDVGADRIYLPWVARAHALVTTPIARAFVDMNRAEDDIRKDGVVKTHTCWDVPIYRAPLPPACVEALLDQHHRPYHAALARGAEDVAFGLDLHTMAAHGPPVGPDPGVERPWVCLGDVRGASCAPRITAALAEAIAAEIGDEHVQVNAPFAGGYITQSRPGGIAWIQIEVSRGPWASDDDKSEALARAIGRWIA